MFLSEKSVNVKHSFYFSNSFSNSVYVYIYFFFLDGPTNKRRKDCSLQAAENAVQCVCRMLLCSTVKWK